MKNFVTFLFACIVLSSHAQFEKIRLAKFEIETKASVGFNMFPTILNVFQNDYANVQKLQNAYVFTVGARADVFMYPIVTNYFSYGFQSHGMVGWLGSNSQNEFGFGHQFRVGLERFKLQLNFSNIKFRKLFVATIPINMPTEEAYSYGLSRYKDIKKFKIGPHLTLKKGQTLLFQYDQEIFLVNNREVTSPGIYVEYMNQNKISWFISYHSNQPVNGINLLSFPSSTTVKKEAISFQVGLRKTFLYSKRYYQMGKNYDLN